VGAVGWRVSTAPVHCPNTQTHTLHSLDCQRRWSRAWRAAMQRPRAPLATRCSPSAMPPPGPSSRRAASSATQPSRQWLAARRTPWPLVLAAPRCLPGHGCTSLRGMCLAATSPPGACACSFPLCTHPHPHPHTSAHPRTHPNTTGRFFISNPDLPKRIAVDALWSKYNRCAGRTAALVCAGVCAWWVSRLHGSDTPLNKCTLGCATGIRSTAQTQRPATLTTRS
jgi:hypothetical protein